MAGRRQRGLCLRRKNLHGYMNEPDFHDYHVLVDGQAENIFAMRDDVGVSTPDRRSALGSISDISQRQCLKNSNEEFVARNEDE
jgi:starvation-inducible DNA-binding protein